MTSAMKEHTKMTAPYPPSGIGSRPVLQSNQRRERQRGRHRDHNPARRPEGENYPPAEMHFLCQESGLDTAYALCEYHHEKAPEQDLTQPRYQALIKVGDCAGVATFTVRYAGDLSWWRVTPLNQLARDLLPEQRMMTEQEWSGFLNSLRDLQLPGLSVQAGVAL
jgi:hypothetical protein